MYTIPVIYGAAGAGRRSSHSSRPPPQAQKENNSIRKACIWPSGGKVQLARTCAERDFPSARPSFGLPGEKSSRRQLGLREIFHPKGRFLAFRGKSPAGANKGQERFSIRKAFFGLSGEKSSRGKLARKRNGALIQNNIFPQFINALTPFSSHSPFINTAAVSQSTQTPSFRVQKQQAFSRRYFHQVFLHSLLPYLYAAIKPQTYLRGFSHTSLFP